MLRQRANRDVWLEERNCMAKTQSRRNTSTPAKRNAKTVAKEFVPTPEQKEAAKAIAARLRVKAPTPVLKIKGKSIEIEGPDEIIGAFRLMEALGTADVLFQNGLISQLANVGSQGSQFDERGLNFMLSMVKGVEPKDEVEAMLAAQMAAVHNATMTFARRLNHVDNLAQQDSAARAFNKLARTFTSQIEALKRYRTGGQQKMTVEHVHVHEGGQAIVGNVQGGGGSAKKQGPTS